jgi:hypothetical protein
MYENAPKLFTLLEAMKEILCANNLQEILYFLQIWLLSEAGLPDFS